MKKLMCLVLSILLVWVLAACGGGSSSSTAASEAAPAAESTAASTADAAGGASEASGGKAQIHVLLNNTKDFQALIKAGYENWAAEHADEADVSVFDAELDVNKQVSQCEMAITNGADAIIITPVDSTTCDAMTDMCKEAGVPLICGQNPADSGYDVWVGSDHTEAGRFEGQWVVDTLGGEGNVAIVYGSLGNDAAQKRWDGAKEVIEAAGMTVVAESTANWERSEAVALMENWLQSDIGPSINAVIGGNDEMAIGALLAAQEAGRDDIIFAGVDATSDALEFVAGDEFQYASVPQDSVNITKTAGDWALKMATGEEVEYGTYVDVPYVLITKDNVADYQ